MSLRTRLPAVVALTALATSADAALQDSRMAGQTVAAPVCSPSGTCTGDASAAFSVGHGSDGSQSPPASMEVASWSFGVSNPTTSSSSMGAGRVTAPRDAASGLATGKRQHGPVKWMPPETISQQRTGMGSGKVSVQDISITKRTAMCGSSTTCSSPSSITLSLLQKDKGPRCVTGTHFPTVVLTARSGASAHLSDVTVASCDASAGTISLSFSKIEWK